MKDEIRELLGIMAKEMAMIWCNAGFTADVAEAVVNGAEDARLRELLAGAWRKSWWWMPELEPRINAALEVQL